MQLQADRDFITAALVELEDFLKSDQVHRLLPAVPGWPRLSLGALLLSQARLTAAGEVLPAELAQVLARRAALVTRRAGQELPQRIRQWVVFSQEVREEGVSRAEYAAAVAPRVMVTLLERELRFPPPEVGRQLALADRRLEQLTRAGDFVWEPDLAAGFPPEQFWYLYRGW